MRTLQRRLRRTKLAQTKKTNAIVMRLVLRKLPTCTTELPVLSFVPYVSAEKLLLAAAVRAPVLAAPSFLTAPVPVGSSSTVRFSAAKPRAHPAAWHALLSGNQSQNLRQPRAHAAARQALSPTVIADDSPTLCVPDLVPVRGK